MSQFETTQDIHNWLKRLDDVALAGLITQHDIAAIILIRIGENIFAPDFIKSYLKHEFKKYSK